MNYTIVPPYTPISDYEKITGEFKNILTFKPAEISGIAGALIISAVALNIFCDMSSSDTTKLIFIGISLLSLSAYRWKHVGKFIWDYKTKRKSLEFEYANNHMYQERKVKNGDNITVASLRYQEDIPVLKLHTSDPYEMGYAHGYILADKITELFEDVLLPMMNLARVLKGDWNRKYFKKQSEDIVIPEKYLIEIHGIFDGIRQAFQEKGQDLTISEEDIINAHKLPDTYKAIGCQKLFGMKAWSAIGCTTVALRQADGSVVGGRTVDWPALIKGGQHILQRIYKTENGMKIQSQTFPGIIHALTASNSSGLVAIINELGTTSCKGIPYGMLAREVIENATSVKEGREMLYKRLNHGKPLEELTEELLGPASSHHLTLISRFKASNFQFCPTPEIKMIERKLESKPFASLIVSNHGVDLSGKTIEGSEADSTSHKRWETVENVLGTNEPYDKSLVKKCLMHATVYDTIAATIYEFEQDDAMPIRDDVHGGSFAGLVWAQLGLKA